jgi:hypothetical protein
MESRQEILESQLAANTSVARFDDHDAPSIENVSALDIPVSTEHVERALNRVIVQIMADESHSRLAPPISAREFIPVRLAAGLPD